VEERAGKKERTCEKGGAAGGLRRQKGAAALALAPLLLLLVGQCGRGRREDIHT